ncbi:MAG: electron transfer flavoprotein subunit alpha/FixB family protein [Bacteroidetes bacterium]|nr:MAG: electron transfer flavoprotein subunit alpha/FixB family protein [Bacteroidota bacterium]
MAVIVFAESWEGKFKKITNEAVSYAHGLAEAEGTNVIAVAVGALESDPAELGKYGASEVVTVEGDAFASFNASVWATAIAEVAEAKGAKHIVLSGTNNGKMIGPMLSVKAGASYISNAIDIPSNFAPFTVRRNAFSNKGLVDYQTNAEKVVVSIVPNALGVKETGGSASVSSHSSSAAADSRVNVVDVDRVKGKIPLPEADLVVSAGRGMKAPENWTMIEELADVLGAGTACSKPVSDIGWRPHSEHVGQTGIQINPSLYIAVGISGAIQHLAGVSGSKTIVVINNDPEAPFFKAADYGIVGDAFEVVPKLTEALKSFKANQ